VTSRACLSVVACAALAACRDEVAPRVAPVEPAQAPTARAAADDFAAVRTEWQKKEREYLKRIGELTSALDEERTKRSARELEWLEFTQAIGMLDVQQAARAPEFLELELPEEEQPTVVDEAAQRERERRRAKRLRDLRAFLTADQVLGLDVLELGYVSDGATGPVVVRLVDDWGRPSGTLAAERLRIEPSIAGRSVTLVFEEGFESHGGVATPFGPPSEPDSKRGGVRRIYLPAVDAEAWIEAFPELIGPQALNSRVDDGRWDLVRVRVTLNELLRNETRGEHWRLRSFAGVVGDELREVHLVQFDLDGRVLRRLFADGLKLSRAGAALRFDLRDGIQERAGRSAPFLEGRYRITFPDAELAAWEQAQLPGLSDPAAQRADD